MFNSESCKRFCDSLSRTYSTRQKHPSNGHEEKAGIAWIRLATNSFRRSAPRCIRANITSKVSLHLGALAIDCEGQRGPGQGKACPSDFGNSSGASEIRSRACEDRYFQDVRLKILMNPGYLVRKRSSDQVGLPNMPIICKPSTSTV